MFICWSIRCFSRGSLGLWGWVRMLIACWWIMGYLLLRCVVWTDWLDCSYIRLLVGRVSCFGVIIICYNIVCFRNNCLIFCDWNVVWICIIVCDRFILIFWDESNIQCLQIFWCYNVIVWDYSFLSIHVEKSYIILMINLPPVTL